MAAFFVGFISTAGINAQAEQNEPSKEKQSVKSLKIESVGSEFLGKINIEEATGYSGNDTIFFNLLSKGDIDNNGFDDLVIALHRHDTTMNYSGRDFEPSGAIKPIVLFYNEKTDNYSVSQQLQSVIADNEHARQASIQDFDGDGRKDIFIADHGYDDAPYGNQNTLLLNKLESYVDGTNMLPRYRDYSHGLITSDFDANGKPDLLVLNNGVQTKTKCEKYKDFENCKTKLKKQSESYVLFNHGVSGLNKGTLKIPNEVINFTATRDLNDKSLRLYVGHGTDLNSDGRADIVISNHKNLFIIESNERGGFKDPFIFSPPKLARARCKREMPYTAINTLDMDQDGTLEIISSFGCGLQQAEFQAFRQHKIEGWVDATDELIGDQSANTVLSDGWCYKFEIYDVNVDGIKDVICQSTRGLGEPTNNVFWYGGEKLEFSGVTLPEGRWYSFQTIVKGINGTYILGFHKEHHERDISLRRWKIK